MKEKTAKRQAELARKDREEAAVREKREEKERQKEVEQVCTTASFAGCRRSIVTYYTKNQKLMEAVMRACISVLQIVCHGKLC